MSQFCALDKCTRTSRGQCDCCNQQLCIQHLTEHNTALMNQLNPLTDEINALSDRLDLLNIENMTGESRRKLEQWRDQCHQQIDHLFQQKCQELNTIMNKKVQKQHDEVIRLQSKIAAVIREQETTRQEVDSLTVTIRDLKKQMDEIEQTSLRVIAQSLVIDDALISIEQGLDLSNLSSPCRTIQRPSGSKVCVCANDNFLLIHRKPNLCLVDREMNIIKEVIWDYEKTFDMCWCSTLDRFIVIEDTRIFLVDQSTMTLERVQKIEKRHWLSCTTSENDLFIGTNGYGTTVMKYNLLPSIKLVTEWKSPQSCAYDEIVYSLKYNNQRFGLLVSNKSEKSLRMELRYANTFDRIWLLKLDTVCEQNIVFRCCLLTYDEWLVADYQRMRLLQIGKDGKLKTIIPYKKVPSSDTLFRNMLCVSRAGRIDVNNLSN